MSIDEHSAALVYALVEVLLRDDPVLKKSVQDAIIQHLEQAGHLYTVAQLTKDQ
jgi:hypothetical protein